MTMRRQFLGAAAAAGIASLKFSKLAAAPSAMAIDWHGHWIGPTVVELMSKRTTAPRYVVTDKHEVFSITRGSERPARPQESSWFDVEERIANLDRAQVQRQVISWVGASFEGALSPEEARPMWRAQNDDLGALVKKYPNRFSGLATLPTANAQWAAEELERAHRDLGLIGATLPLDAFITLEGARTLAPIFAVAQKNHSHIMIHRGPANSSIPGALPEVGATNAYFGLVQPAVKGDYPLARTTLITSTHLATGVITLALTDFLDAYPDVTVQMAMIGGSISFVAEQIEFAEEAGRLPSSLKKFHRIYVDTGNSGRGPRGIAMAAQVFGADRILFGSDYGPSSSIQPYIDSVQRAPISESEKQAILVQNGRALLAAKGIRAA